MSLNEDKLVNVHSNANDTLRIFKRGSGNDTVITIYCTEHATRKTYHKALDKNLKYEACGGCFVNFVNIITSNNFKFNAIQTDDKFGLGICYDDTNFKFNFTLKNFTDATKFIDASVFKKYIDDNKTNINIALSNFAGSSDNSNPPQLIIKSTCDFDLNAFIEKLKNELLLENDYETVTNIKKIYEHQKQINKIMVQRQYDELVKTVKFNLDEIMRNFPTLIRDKLKNDVSKKNAIEILKNGAMLGVEKLEELNVPHIVQQIVFDNYKIHHLDFVSVDCNPFKNSNYKEIANKLMDEYFCSPEFDKAYVDAFKPNFIQANFNKYNGMFFGRNRNEGTLFDKLSKINSNFTEETITKLFSPEPHTIIIPTKGSPEYEKLTPQQKYVVDELDIEYEKVTEFYTIDFRQFNIMLLGLENFKQHKVPSDLLIYAFNKCGLDFNEIKILFNVNGVIIISPSQSFMAQRKVAIIDILTNHYNRAIKW